MEFCVNVEIETKYTVKIKICNIFKRKKITLIFKVTVCVLFVR